jgi:2',3'-cyclic-nucleotide 2'-phosphodiesterase (5'-nucleotidase family)
MQHFIILHTNDIHARIEALARIGTLVARIRADNPDVPVLYFDAGDVEDPGLWLSHITRGRALHRLLGKAGCDAYAVGNGMFFYGPNVLAGPAERAPFPMLLANMRVDGGAYLPGVQPTATFEVGSLRLGVVGVTDDPPVFEERMGVQMPEAAGVVREQAARLRAEGVEAVIVLSHMGMDHDWGLGSDPLLAQALQGVVPLIIGGHSHTLLPEGERIGDVVIAQAGCYGEYLGRIDLTWDGSALQIDSVSVMPVPEDIPPSPEVLAELARIRQEIPPLRRRLGATVGFSMASLFLKLDRMRRGKR